MTAPHLTIYGTVQSTYSRIVETVAEEAGLGWSIVPTPAGSPENRARHPFGKVPSVEIDGLALTETVAIAQYVDTVHNGGALHPADPVARAEMDRWIAIANNYVFPMVEHGLLLPYLAHRHLKVPLRSDVVEAALPEIGRQLGVLCDRVEVARWFAGDTFTLADIFVYCIVRPAELTNEGAHLIQPLLPLRHRMNRVGARDSVKATRWPGEMDGRQ